MNTFEITAIIGAASWINPIIFIMYKKLTKPKIKLIPEEVAEIGYSIFGPILNIRCAISIEKKDGIIERIEAEIEHENGDKHSLLWKFLDEVQFEFRSFSGEGGIVGKNQPAIALKVSPQILVEKKIGFQDIYFQEKYQLLFNEFLNYINFLIKTDSLKSFDQLFTSKEFTDLNDFFTKSFYWKVGSYKLCIRTYVNSVKAPFEETWKFHLENKDIDVLQKNTMNLEAGIRSFLEVNLMKEQPSQSSSVIWNWVYPKLEKINN